jgi:hypothetical protein
MVLVKLAIDLGCAVPAVHCALVRGAAISPSIHGFSKVACEATIGVIEMFSSISSPITVLEVDTNNSRCDGPDSGLTFVIFVHLLVGALLPLCITYWFERGVKLRWLHMIRYHATPRAPSALGKFLWTMLWVGVCGAITQLLMDSNIYSNDNCITTVL